VIARRICLCYLLSMALSKEDRNYFTGLLVKQSGQLHAEVRTLGAELRAEMKAQGDELRSEMKALGTELRAEMKAQKEELMDMIVEQTQTTLEAVDGVMKKRLSALDTKLTRKVDLILVEVKGAKKERKLHSHRIAKNTEHIEQVELRLAGP